MKLLLDTHIFLWYVAADARLPTTFRDSIRDPNNQVYLSAASVWEAVIKHRLGKLPLPAPPVEYLLRQREAHQFAALPIEEETMTHLANLPDIHRDPFDRILVAQAIQYRLTLVTLDADLKAYPVPTLAQV